MMIAGGSLMNTDHASSIKEVEARDLENLTQMLVGAFQEDPFFHWLVPSGTAHERRLAHLFLWFLRRALDDGTILATQELSGAILIMPPGRWKLGIRQQLAELRLGIRVFGLARLVPRVVEVDALERQAPSVRHFYIPLLATAPDVRGRGIGSSLLERALGMADADRVPTYLENTNELNVPFYQRFGFTVVDVFHMARHAPPMWLMIRYPRGSVTKPQPHNETRDKL